MPLSREDASALVSELLGDTELSWSDAKYLGSMRDTLESWRSLFVTDRMTEVLLDKYQKVTGVSWGEQAPKLSERDRRDLQRLRSAMAPSEFARHMAIIVGSDCWEQHISADKLLCSVLDQLGYADGVAVFMKRHHLNVLD